MRKIYFDSAATSFPKAPKLAETVSDFIENNSVNINRGIYDLSSDLCDEVFETRVMLARFFDCDEVPEKFCKRIIFTSGVTASLNMFLRGLLCENDHVIVGALEHHAVMRTLYALKKERNITFDVALCDERGRVLPQSVESLITPDTKAVVINHASNVFGTVSPIEEIGEVCKCHNVFFAVDTAQTAGVIDISMRKANVDFLAFSGHKGLLGLQGIGGFAISEKLSDVLKPTITGGTGSSSHFYTQPDNLPDKFESGTLNLCGIISLRHSLGFIEKTGVKNIRDKELFLRKYFIDSIKDIGGVKIYCENENVETTAVVSLVFENHDNAYVASKLSSDYGVMTRCGLHCSPLAHSSMGSYPGGTVRFSFSYFNTEDEIDICVEGIRNILKENYNG